MQDVTRDTRGADWPRRHLESRFPRPLVLLFITLLLAAGAPVPLEASEPSVASPAFTGSQNRLGLDASDLAAMTAYRIVLAELAPAVWPGWGTQVPPLLQLGEEREYLIGHPAPPAGFSETDIEVHGATVWVAPAGTVSPGPYATTWEVAGVWSAMLPLRPVFAAVVDAQLGEGVVTWDDATYLRSMVHEAFHAHQLTVRPDVPDFGSGSVGDREAIAALTQLPDLEERYAVEARWLRAALEAADLAEARQAARRFLGAREDCRNQVSAAVGAYEQLMEWMEGTARYADLLLLARAGDRPVAPANLDLPPGESVLADHLDDLTTPGPRADGVRGWWQALGSAQALLLDRLMIGWRHQFLYDSIPLEQLVARAVNVPEALLDLPVTTIHINDQPLDVAVAARPEHWTTGLAGVRDLDPLAGLLFVFPDDLDLTRVGFTMEGASIPLDIAFFDVDGILLDVRTMPLCPQAPCPIYAPDRPYRTVLEAPAGALVDLRAGARLRYWAP